MNVRRLQDDEFFIVHDWMISELGLGGDTLIVYACIYTLEQRCEPVKTKEKSLLADLIVHPLDIDNVLDTLKDMALISDDYGVYKSIYKH